MVQRAAKLCGRRGELWPDCEVLKSELWFRLWSETLVAHWKVQSFYSHHSGGYEEKGLDQATLQVGRLFAKILQWPDNKVWRPGLRWQCGWEKDTSGRYLEDRTWWLENVMKMSWWHSVFGLDAAWMMVPLPEPGSHKVKKAFHGRKGCLLICMCWVWDVYRTPSKWAYPLWGGNEPWIPERDWDGETDL